MVSVWNRDWLLLPMTIRLMLYRPMLVTMPARMEGTASLVCKKAVMNPAAAEAAMPAGRARMGCPARHIMADTALPSTKAPSVVISAIFKMEKLRNRAKAMGA